jgi:hypothetical protein
MEYTALALIVFIVIMVFMFSSVSLTYVDDSAYAGVPIDQIDNRQKPGRMARASIPPMSNSPMVIGSPAGMAKAANTRPVGLHNPDAPKQGLFGLPEKDEYMNPGFKAQIDELKTKFYYDNCRFRLV